MTTREKMLWVMVLLLTVSVILSNWEALTTLSHPVGMPCHYEYAGPMNV